MNFSSIGGHTTIKKRLRDGVQHSRVPHAQLFAGDSSTEALPLAIAYARYILCPNRTDSDPCEVCPACYRTSKLEHPDLHFVFPVNRSKRAVATGRSGEKPISDQFIALWREFIVQNSGIFTETQWYEYIGIENQQGNIAKEEANEIIRKMSFKSFEGGYKIVIIYLPERMGEAAANTLLKLVEEPPPSTLFLMVSETPDRVIGTIRSRVQQIALAPIHSKATLLSDNSEFYELFTTLMRKAYQGRYIELFDWAESAATIGREAHKAFVEYSIALLRECYIIGIGVSELSNVSGEALAFAKNFSPFVSSQTIEPLVKEFELVGAQIRQNGAPKIIFTHFALMVSKILVSAKRSVATGK